MDQYILKICENGDGGYFYYKNGLLHREDGPAIIYLENIEYTEALKNNKLYKIVILEKSFPEDYAALFVDGEFEEASKISPEMVPARYYLEGKPYSKKDFDTIALNKELQQSLSVKDIVNKKNKI